MSRFDDPGQGVYDIFDDPDNFTSGIAGATNLTQAQELTEPTASQATDPAIVSVVPGTPAENETGVVITVSDDRGAQGTFVYDGVHAVTVTNYTPGNPATYEVDWPVVSSPGSITPFNTARGLVFTTEDSSLSSAAFDVSTAPDPAKQFGVALANDLGVAGMWDNDVDVEFGVDQYYGTLTPPDTVDDWDLTNIDKGVLNAVPSGGTFVYQYFDVTPGLWSGFATESFSIASAVQPDGVSNAQALTTPTAIRVVAATPDDVEQAQNTTTPSVSLGGQAAAENFQHAQELTTPTVQKVAGAAADNVVQLHALSEPVARKSFSTSPEDVEQAQFTNDVQAQGEDPVPLNMVQSQVLTEPFLQRRGLSSIETAFTQQYDDLDGRYFPPHRKRRRR